MRVGIVGASRVLPPDGERRVSSSPFKEWVPVAHRRRMGRASRIAYLAAARALKSVKSDDEIQDADCVLIAATALGEVNLTLNLLRDLHASRGRQVSPLKVPGSVHNALAGYLSIGENLTSATITVSAGRLSGEAALSAAMDLLTAGRGRRALVVAADELDPDWADEMEARGDPDRADRLRSTAVVEGGAALVLDAAPTGEPEYGWIEEAAVTSVRSRIARKSGVTLVCRSGAGGDALLAESGDPGRLESGRASRTLAGPLALLAAPGRTGAELHLAREGDLLGIVRWTDSGLGNCVGTAGAP